MCPYCFHSRSHSHSHSHSHSPFHFPSCSYSYSSFVPSFDHLLLFITTSYCYSYCYYRDILYRSEAITQFVKSMCALFRRCFSVGRHASIDNHQTFRIKIVIFIITFVITFLPKSRDSKLCFSLQNKTKRGR